MQLGVGSMARTVGAALRPVDGNTTTTQQLAEAGHCAHSTPGTPGSAAAADQQTTPVRPAYVPAATQDEVAEQVATDHLKNMNLNLEDPSVVDSPAFTVHADSVRSPPQEATDPTTAVRVDEFLTVRVLYVPRCDEGAVPEFQPCGQRLVSSMRTAGEGGGCDIDASIPAAGAQDVAAGRVLVGLELCNTHASASYTVQVRVDAGPADAIVVAPGETVLSTAPRSGPGVPPEICVRRGQAPLSPRSAAIPTEDSFVVVFTRPDPIGIVFDECEDARDGERYLVVNSVHPGTQAAELRDATAEASGAGAALIRPGMIVQKISGGDEDTEVHVSSLYHEHGQVPPQIFAMRPLGLVLSAPDHGIIEAELLERPGDEKASESEVTALPPLVRIRIS